ncbi:MAG: hypothetical protein ACBZ72_02105 [Candidatus Bathyarchaeia archaeon]|jgi:hypothetical protein
MKAQEGKKTPNKNPKLQNSAKVQLDANDPECLQAMDEGNAEWVQKWKKTIQTQKDDAPSS